jgi:hypothetical protein
MKTENPFLAGSHGHIDQSFFLRARSSRHECFSN